MHDRKIDKEILYWPFLIQIVVGHHRNIDIVHLYTVYIKNNDPILLSWRYINERMLACKNDTDIVQSSLRMLGKIRETTVDGTVKWKRAASPSQTVHEHLNQTFQCTRRIKTHLLVYQSANTVVKLTGLPDLLHTLTGLRAPVMNEPRRAAYAHTITTFDILDIPWHVKT